MSRKRYTPEEIIGKLREAEVRLSQGEKIGVICRALGVSEQSYYRWRREYGGLKVDQAKRLRDFPHAAGMRLITYRSGSTYRSVGRAR